MLKTKKTFSDKMDLAYQEKSGLPTFMDSRTYTVISFAFNCGRKGCS